jgi:acetoin utilization protein AcuC
MYPVGSTLRGFESIMSGEVDHFFNPVGGLHHARRERAGGFCVFNDAAIVIEKAIKSFAANENEKDVKSNSAANNRSELRGRKALPSVAYVDIDCHHGDGVFYAFEDDPRVIIADIHEDGRYLYPGTGSSDEIGTGYAKGTKLNIPLPPDSGDNEFFDAFDKVSKFLRSFGPFECIFLQCGADGLAADPITHLRYTEKAHEYAAKELHKLAHETCAGRILAMGGGGYNPQNVASAWMAVVNELCSPL